MSAGMKKTLYFAVESGQEINKNLTKNLILEDIALDAININNGKTYNILNIKLLPDDEDVLELEFEQLEELLGEQVKSYIEEFKKKYPFSLVIEERDIKKLEEKFENDREERLTAHLSEEQKMVRARLIAFKRKLNLSGSEASFVSNIFEDIISLKIIDEDTPLGNQKKSINTFFKDRRYLVDLLMHEVEVLQRKVVEFREGEEIKQFDGDMMRSLDFRGIWPDWQKLASDQKEAEKVALETAAAQKRGRGRPKKNQF